MALFNITNNKKNKNCSDVDFRASNQNIKVDTLKYKISELQITYCTKGEIDFKASNNSIKVDTLNYKISELQIII